MPDPDISSNPTALPAASHPPRRRQRYDWNLAARLLAEAQPPEVIAARIGRSTEQFWRYVNRSPRFAALVEQAIQRRQVIADIQRDISPNKPE
jgi:hypothetical protein